jgi:hypothetical protein
MGLFTLLHAASPGDIAGLPPIGPGPPATAMHQALGRRERLKVAKRPQIGLFERQPVVSACRNEVADL